MKKLYTIYALFNKSFSGEWKFYLPLGQLTADQLKQISLKYKNQPDYLGEFKVMKTLSNDPCVYNRDQMTDVISFN